MRVLIINSGKDLYGSEQSMLAALPEGDRLFAIPAGGTLAAELKRRGEKFFFVAFNCQRFLRHPFGHIRLLRQLIGLELEFRPDVILVNLGGNMPVIITAAALLRIPVVRFERFEVKAARPGAWWVLESFCEAVICPSQTVANQVRQGMRKQSACVLPWYDPIMAVAVADRPIARTGGADIIYAGRICPNKRIDVAIRAMQLVWEKVPSARLLIYGGHNGSIKELQLEEELRDLARQIDSRGQIVFAGFYSALLERIADGAVLVLPSESESFGRVLAEAWLMGVPTVASDISGCAEITLASGGGSLAPKGNVPAFARALSNLLLDTANARQIGSRGSQWVKKNCSPIVYRRKLTHLLRSVAEKNHCLV